MTNTRGRDPSNTDSTHDLLAGWNIEEVDESIANPASSEPQNSRGEVHRVDPSSRSSPWNARAHPSRRDLDAFPGFVLGESRAEVSTGLKDSLGEGLNRTTRKKPGVVRGTETVRGRKPGAVRDTPPPSSRSSGPGRFPHPGDLLAGFQILQELGRGAFARVYLAEEIHLGRRLVAIKVSRPEGEEPQILARLQHTHIVPVHSVCDDPETGLRILCMPYFGGANLAQVLDAAGGLDQTEHHGQSLVDAIDLLSQRLVPTSGSGSFAVAPTARSARPDCPSTVPAGKTGLVDAEGLDRSLSVSRFRSFFHRWVGSGAATPRRVPGACDEDLHQPSRQFLRRATAIQAAVWIVARLAEGLDHAHSRGLLHRDLKPANILLAADGTPMLLDFNLAAEIRPESAEGEIRRALVGGTMPYMAPSTSTPSTRAAQPLPKPSTSGPTSMPSASSFLKCSPASHPSLHHPPG